MKYGFGIDVGGTSVKLALFDLEGNIVEKMVHSHPHGRWRQACPAGYCRVRSGMPRKEGD